MKTINITLRTDDAEQILRAAALDAARFSAWVDYVTPKTHEAPFASNGQTRAEQKARWKERFLKAKRMVEAFGVEYEMTSEEETLTVTYRWIGGKAIRRTVGNLAFNEIVGSKPDYANPEPCYRRNVHEEACRAAADRVVRRWRAGLAQGRAAA